MRINCWNCNTPVPAEKRDCQACGEDNGAPNVRLAESESEKASLSQRVRDAAASSKARGCEEILARFGAAVLRSHAVIARPLGVVQDLVEDGRTYTSYHKQLASGARVAEENEWDLTRTQVEAALFPNFHAEIVFASLTLDGAGMSGYGAYTLVLKEATISRRASVFEGNPYDLADRLKWLLTKPIPQGYRAIWSERNLLAQAKLHVELTPVTADVEFPAILARDGGGTGNSDFIEVHIYGALNKYAVEKVLGPKAATREDREILKRLGRKLIELGATLELS